MRGFGTARCDSRTSILRMAVYSCLSPDRVPGLSFPKENCTDLEVRPAPAGLHVIEAKELTDTARRSNRCTE